MARPPPPGPSPTGFFTVGVGQGNIQTEKTFGDFRLHLEFNVPLMPEAKGQARGNSGVYLGGIYELQVLDSYGLTPKSNDCGAIYQQVVPRVNACKPPLQWQTYDVTFHKARVEGGKVSRKARLTVIQNGIKIIDDAEISPTPGGARIKEGEDGPLLLQDHGNKVEFRNIWISRSPPEPPREAGEGRRPRMSTAEGWASAVRSGPRRGARASRAGS